jgi:hypothetical protein
MTPTQCSSNQGIIDPTTARAPSRRSAIQPRWASPIGRPDYDDTLRSTTNAAFPRRREQLRVSATSSTWRTRSRRRASNISTDVVSASTDYGIGSTRVDYFDVNGDGLP